jgi:uncharacterized membrane protein
MDRMLVVVFNNEAKAYEGKKALMALDAEGSIAVYAYAVATRNPDGTVNVKQGDDTGLATLATTALGTLIGAAFGPVGLAIGATAGFAGGASFDLANAAVGEDFISDVTAALTPGKVAVIAEIEEDWNTPVDSRMEALGGLVFRRTLSSVRHQIHDENVGAMKADMAQMKAEHAQARADRKAKLAEKINQLDTKIQAQLDKAKEQRLATERDAQAKANLLKQKASAALAATK